MSNQVTLLEKNKYSLQKIYFDVNFNLRKNIRTILKGEIRLKMKSRGYPCP